METLAPFICGTETEYSIMYYGPPQKGGKLPVLDGAQLPAAVVSRLPERLFKFGEYTSNGGRLYIDVGQHIEWATPECVSYDEIVAYELAGEAIVLHGLEELVKEGMIYSYMLNKRVVDSHGNNWGAHENYQISRLHSPGDSRGSLQPAIAGFLAMRNALVGGGKVDRTGKYSLAQKAFHLQHLFSSSTQNSRGLINSRDVPYDDADKYRRLHLICGDASVLPWSLAMKVGMTAVLLRLVHEQQPLGDLYINNPEYVGRQIANDPTFSKQIEVSSGKKMTAAQYLSELASRAEVLSLQKPLPRHEQEVITEMKWACDKLEFHRDELFELSDCVTKGMLYEHYKDTRPRKDGESEEDYIAKLRRLDLEFDTLGKNKGRGAKLRDKSDFDMAEAQKAIVEPPSTTRACLRGKAVKYAAKCKSYHTPKVKSVRWPQIELEPNKTVTLSASQNRCPELEAIFADAEI